MVVHPLVSAGDTGDSIDPVDPNRVPTTHAAPWRLSTPVAALSAAVAGLVLVLAFPSTGWWPLAPVAVALLAVAAKGRSRRAGALTGALAGLAFFLPHLHWSGVYVGVLPWAALAVLETIFFAVMGALLPGVWLAREVVLRRASGGPRLAAPPVDDDESQARAMKRAIDSADLLGALLVTLGVAGLWVLQETLRSRLPFGGFPWGRLAFSQSDGPLAAWAWLGGAPLVSAVVAGIGGAIAVTAVGLAETLGPARRPSPSTVMPAIWGPLNTGLALAVVGTVAVTLAAHDGAPLQSPMLQVAAVQGDVPEAGLEFNAERRAVLDNHVQGTVQLAEQVDSGAAEQPDLVFWPENASDIDPLRNPDAAEVITTATDAIGVPILVGAVLREPVGHLSNAGIVWGPTGSAHPGPGERYVKQHPAPFAEYIPYRSFFRNFSTKVDLVRTDFIGGTRSGALAMGPTTVGDVICFEVAYDGLVRQAVKDGAQLLVVQTNNATFGYTDESVQQLAMSRLRAIETGRSVVHISTVGVSAIFGPDGVQLARSGHFTPEVLQARIPLRSQTTPAVRMGALPEALLAALGLGIALGGFFVTRRGRRAVRPNAKQT
jgi:apolipoprotein N-acyltransferase